MGARQSRGARCPRPGRLPHPHRLAEHYLLGERHAHTLQPTALVNEAYIRLIDDSPSDWNSRDHFYGVAAHLMRQVLVDHAAPPEPETGRRSAEGDARRGRGLPAPGPPAEILALNDALEELAGADPRKCQVVELRYFAGCTEEETARALKLSPATVRRDLRAAEAWLSARLHPAS